MLELQFRMLHFLIILMLM